MKLSRKLSIVALVFVISMVFFGVFAMNTLKNNLIDSRKHEIQSILTFSVNQARHFIELEQANKMTRQEAEDNVIRVFSNMRDGNSFLWANDANGIARVHIKDGVVGVFQASYAKYIGYLTNHPFMFVVGESEKAGSKALYVKVNGMTLLPEWNWILGIGVYIDELESELNRLVIYLVLASVIIFIVVFGAVFWVYRSVMKQLGDDPKSIIELVLKAENEGFLASNEDRYPKNSLLYLMRNFYLHIHSILTSLHQQNESLSKNSVDLVCSTKTFGGLINAAAEEGKQVGDVLTRNKKQAEKIHTSLASCGEYLDVVASRVTDSVIFNTNNESTIKKIDADIIDSAHQLTSVGQKIPQLETLIELLSHHASLESSSHNDSFIDAKRVISELKQQIASLQSSIELSGGSLTSFLTSFGEQKVSLESLRENLTSVQQQIGQIVQDQEHLMHGTPTELDQHFDEILTALTTITGLILEHKTKSDKMSHDLDSIHF